MSKLKIHHIAITSQNLKKMQRFYESLPGFPKAEKKFRNNGELRSLWFVVDGMILMIEKGKTQKAPFACIFELKKWKDSDISKLKKKIRKKTDFTIYLSDPDGNTIGYSTYPRAFKAF